MFEGGRRPHRGVRHYAKNLNGSSATETMMLLARVLNLGVI